MNTRLRGLLTGRVEWYGDDDQITEVEWLGWRDRWALFGVHSSNWAWVRRCGARPCGCTINPLTRRRVLTRMDCPDHGLSWLLEDDDENGPDGDAVAQNRLTDRLVLALVQALDDDDPVLRIGLGTDRIVVDWGGDPTDSRQAQ